MSIDYATIPFTSGTFPNVTSVNSSGEATYDGTPLLKLPQDDVWGFSQAVLDASNQTPAGTAESAGNSQVLTGIQRIAGHPGELVWWHGANKSPETLGIRLLPLEGQTILISSYPDLADAVYVGDTDNPTAVAYYKRAGVTGPRDIAGTHLVLPDYQGVFVRGYDAVGAADPDGTDRAILPAYGYGWVQSSRAASQSPVTPLYGATTMRRLEVATMSYTSGGDTADVVAVAAPPLVGVEDVKGYLPSDETRSINKTAQICIRY